MTRKNQFNYGALEAPAHYRQIEREEIARQQAKNASKQNVADLFRGLPAAFGWSNQIRNNGASHE